MQALDARCALRCVADLRPKVQARSSNRPSVLCHRTPSLHQLPCVLSLYFFNQMWIDAVIASPGRLPRRFALRLSRYRSLGRCRLLQTSTCLRPPAVHRLPTKLPSVMRVLAVRPGLNGLRIYVLGPKCGPPSLSTSYRAQARLRLEIYRDMVRDVHTNALMIDSTCASAWRSVGR